MKPFSCADTPGPSETMRIILLINDIIQIEEKSGGDMAKPGAYKSEKRKKELKRQKKQEEKRNKRTQKDPAAQEQNPETEPQEITQQQ
jgi:hypothetical protein